MRNSGKVDVIGLLVVAAIIAGLYFGIMLAPAVTDNMDVQGAVDIAYNNSARDDDVLKSMIEDRLRYVGEHEEDDGFGNLKLEKGLGLTDDDITIDRDTVNNIVTITVNYERKVELKPFHRWLVMHFHPHKSGPPREVVAQ